MKIVKLNSEQFDHFAANHRFRNYHQTSMYGRVISNFGYHSQYIGFVNEYNKLVAATLIIYKDVWKNNKIAYAPRGILCNYEDKEQVQEITDLLKKTLGKQNFMILRIDPCIPLTVRDTEGNIMNLNEKGNEIIYTLQDNGYNYLGKTLFFETEKPRWEALIMLQRDIRDIFAHIDKRARNKIRKAKKNGLAVFRDPSKNVNKLYEYVGKKDKKPLDFYQEMVDQYGDNIEIYYVKIKTESFVNNSQKNYEREQEYNEKLAEKIQDIYLDPKEKSTYLNKKIESDKLLTAYKNNLLKATELLKQKPEGIIVAGAMVIKFDNVAYIYTEGTDNNYSTVNPSYFLKWKIIETFNDQGFKYVNLNGINGDFDNKNPKQNPYIGLNESKLCFSATVIEYIGEFDLILNKMTYALYNKINKNQ